MALHDDEFKIPRLSGDNYHFWAIRVKAALVHKNCWGAIDPGYDSGMTEAERKSNEKAITFLFLVVEDSYLNDISECTTAKEAWDTLECMHTKYGLLHILQLMRDLFNMKLKKNEEMKDYLGRITALHQKLKKCNYGMDDKELALIMLLGLPDKYEPLILHLEQKDVLTTKEVKTSLLLEERRQRRRNEEIEETHQPKALISMEHKGPRYHREETTNKSQYKVERKPTPRDTRYKEDNMKKVRCFCCGKFGHIARNCSNAEEDSKNAKWTGPKAKKTIEQLKHVSLSVSNGRMHTSNIWFLDSGASDHMTCHLEKFTTFIPTTSFVEVANHEKLEVKGKGELTMETFKRNGGHTILLKDVLYVPNLDGNLLSIGKIEEKGREVSFANGKAIVKEGNGDYLLIAERQNHLYSFETKPPTARICKLMDEMLWHKRLGHIHQKLSKIQTPVCETCMRGKIKRKKFPKEATTRATAPLELIHSDVMGPIKPISKGGSKWTVTFIDDYSRFIQVYFMKHKSDVLDAFKAYQLTAERQLNRKIKTLRSDNGREYCNNEFDRYLEGQGIKRQLTVVNTPQQNGVAERCNQTLMDITRCLLLESGMPQTFWADALDTAAYIKNKCPSKTTQNIPPEELWSGKQVEKKHLRVFGCQVWSAVREPRRRSKLDPKGEKCALLGYTSETKGYKLWNPETGRISISRDVTFNENIFPCKTQTQNNEDVENDETLYFGNHEEIESIDDQGQKGTTMINPSGSTEGEEEDEDNTTGSTKDEEEEEDNTTGSTKDKEEEEDNDQNPQPKEDTINKSLLVNQCPKTKDNQDPKNLEEALTSKDADKWREAMQDELNSLEENQTWKLVPRPTQQVVLGSKWIFKRKYNTSGKLEKYKARLVARGFKQSWGVDYWEVFSPVVKQKSLRLLLAIAIERNWVTRQIDIKTAYLNGRLDETVYMERPKKETPYRDDSVCLLQRSLYGLKQAGRQWNIALDTFLKTWGMEQSKADPCVYHHPTKNIMLGVYVDDLLIIAKENDICQKFYKDINKEFGAKDLGEASELLSIKIHKGENGEIHLSQEQYIKEVLNRYNMTDSKGANTPLPLGTKLKKQDVKTQLNAPYRQAIGSLLYVSGSTRPDLAYTTSHLSQFNENASKEHWEGVKHACRYLQKTKTTKLTYRPTGKKLTIYADSDWGSDINDRKSYSGYALILAGGAISWGSRKQRCTALSTVESEYIALCEVSKEVMWFKHLLKELNATEFIDDTTIIYSDSQGAINLAQKKITSERNKHISLKYFFIRDLIENGEIELKYIPSKSNPADILTKIISPPNIAAHRETLGLQSSET